MVKIAGNGRGGRRQQHERGLLRLRLVSSSHGARGEGNRRFARATPHVFVQD